MYYSRATADPISPSKARKKTSLAGLPFSYALTIDDAKKDGVLVKILMDPMAKKRTALRYSGIGVCAAGCVTGIWCWVQASNDQKTLSGLKNTQIGNIKDNLYQNSDPVYSKALDARNRDEWIGIAGFVLALLGATGVGLSFTF